MPPKATQPGPAARAAACRSAGPAIRRHRGHERQRRGQQQEHRRIAVVIGVEERAHHRLLKGYFEIAIASRISISSVSIVVRILADDKEPPLCLGRRHPRISELANALGTGLTTPRGEIWPTS